MTLDLGSNFLLFSLVFMRMSGCFVFHPIFGRNNMPMPAKSGIILLVSWIVYSVTDVPLFTVDNLIGYSALLLKEFAVGYILGAVFQFFVGAVLFAGTVMDNQMGLSMSTIYDPQSNSSVSLSANFLNIMFMVCFFAADAHLALIRIFLTSAEVVPYGTIGMGPEVWTAMAALFAEFISFGMRLAMPMLAIQFMVEIGVGILMKTIPQINIFVINIQMKIWIGLLILLILFSPLSEYLANGIDLLLESTMEILSRMKP